jgi:hypothetical protein
VAIPEPVRRLALHPFRELPLAPGVQRIERAGVVTSINAWPMAQIVEPVGAGPGDLAAAVEATRELAREHRKRVLAWWIAREHDHLAPGLVELGLVHKDTPGFEAVENSMALLSRPAGAPVEGVEVRPTASFEEYKAAGEIPRIVFGLPEISEAELRDRYAEFTSPESSGVQFMAFVDGRVVACAFAALAVAGVNLLGGAVLPEARGSGVYRALTLARWELAVERGTPALTVQAGRMSMPILERLGFEHVGAVRLFVDEATGI